MDLATAALSVLTGTIGGVIGSLVAPFVHWGIEKRRDRRAAQRDLLDRARLFVGSGQFSAGGFQRSAEYSRLKAYLDPDLVRVIEHPDEARDQMDDPSEFYDAVRSSVLDELTRVEREWKLI